MIRRLTVIVLSIFLMLALSACGNSASSPNNTDSSVQRIQTTKEDLEADVYEIVPEEQYTDADLAHYTGGRADQEQNDPDARPAISGSVKNMDGYDTIILSYPIWLAYHNLIQCTQA